ncbi:MAG TPA: glycosyl hydrolase-related protein, partial [bacterium]|nr:glycosyl hydrolase-related protein [bacterium]
DYILRFYETEGRKTTATIELGWPVFRVNQTDLRGNIIRRLPSGQTIKFSVNPWQIVTLRLQTKGASPV